MTQLRLEPAVIKRIAIFRALFVGDLLCSAPALRALQRGFPGAEITLIGLPWAQEFVEHVPYIDRLLVFPGYPGINEVPVQAEQTAGFLKAARATGYDLAIQMHGDGNVSNGFVAELGARTSLGFCRAGDARLSMSLLYLSEEHEVRRWLRLVAALGIDASDIRIDFPLTRAERRLARRLLSPAHTRVRGAGPLIGLHTGAKDAARRWPAECFAALADMLVERLGARIVLTGSESERAITTAVRRSMHHEARDLAGTTSLGEFTAVIEALDLLVTNDTGASHIAAATETPSVVLFGLSRPEGWAPLDRGQHRIVDALAFAPRGYDPAEALGRLPVEPVYDACTHMLGSRHRLQPAADRAGRDEQAAHELYRASHPPQRHAYGTSLTEGDA